MVGLKKCFLGVSSHVGALKSAHLQHCMGTAEGGPMWPEVGFRRVVVMMESHCSKFAYLMDTQIWKFGKSGLVVKTLGHS